MNTNNNNTNLTTNNTSNSGSSQNGQSNQGGSDVGGIGNVSISTRQVLAQQAELLTKIEAILENQARLELALRTSLIASNANLIQAARQEANANV